MHGSALRGRRDPERRAAAEWGHGYPQRHLHHRPAGRPRPVRAGGAAAVVAGRTGWSCRRRCRPGGGPARERPAPRHHLTGGLGRRVGHRPRARGGQGVRHPPVRDQRQADADLRHGRGAGHLRRRHRHPGGQAALGRHRRDRAVRTDRGEHRGDPPVGHREVRRPGHDRHRRRGGGARLPPQGVAPSPGLDRSSPSPTTLDRRHFLFGAAAIGGAALAVGGVGRYLAQRFDVSAVRSAISLPRARSAATPLPAGAELGIEGITPFVTSNDDFYRVDTALSAAAGLAERLDASRSRAWSTGTVELQLRRPPRRGDSSSATSPWSASRTRSAARTPATPAGSACRCADLLSEAGVQDGADQLVSRSVDGWTAGTPTRTSSTAETPSSRSGMNGEPLPVNHGFPVRLVIPGALRLQLGDQVADRARAHDLRRLRRLLGRARLDAEQGPLKTLTRIDTPRGLANVPAGTTRHRRRGLGHAPRHRARRGQGRRRAVDAGPARRRSPAATPGGSG